MAESKIEWKYADQKGYAFVINEKNKEFLMKQIKSFKIMMFILFKMMINNFSLKFFIKGIIYHQ